MNYPECEKFAKVADESNAIENFLVWLREKNIVLFQWHDEGDNGEPKFIDDNGNPTFNIHSQFTFDDSPESDIPNPDYETHPEGYYRVFTSFEKLSAQYFDLDLNKVEKERQQMLEEIRKL